MLATPRLAALRAQIALFPSRVAARGRHYAGEGRVTDVALTGDGVWALVEGTDTYESGWEWLEDEGAWSPDCSCPAGPECKHTYALACCVLAEPALIAAANEPPDAPRPGRGAAAPQPARGGGSARAARSPLDLFRSARDPWIRQQALEMLLALAPVRELARRPAVLAALEDPDVDLACWRMARAIAHAANGWLPPALERYRQWGDLAARFTAREQQLLGDELALWAGAHRETPERSLRLAFGLARQSDGGARVTLEVRLTSPRLRDVPRTPAQLHQLRSEAGRNPALLPSEQAALLEWLPDHAATGPYYGWVPTRPALADGARLHLAPGQLVTLLPRLTGPLAAIATWSDETGLDAELAARGGVVAGAPVRLLAHCARLLPTCIERDGDVRIELAFLWPDGCERRADEAVSLRGVDPWSGASRSLVLAEGAFSLVAEEPPAPLVERFAAAGGLSLPPARRPAVIGMLAARFPHLEAAIAPHRRVRPATPAVALDLREDDWLQVRLFAHAGVAGWRPGAAPAGGIVFEYAPGSGWVRRGGAAAGEGGERPAAGDPAYDAIASLAGAEALAGAPPPGACAGRDAAPGALGNEVWIEVPDPATVAPAVAWLDSLGARAGAERARGGHCPPWADHATGWWMPARRQSMEAFAGAWEARPTGVQYFATERLRRLLGAGGRVSARVRIAPSGVDWLTVSAEWEAEGRALSDADLAKLRSATTCFVRLGSGWVRREVVAEHDEATALLADLGVEAGAGEQRVGLWQLAGARPATLAALARLGADAETVRAIEDLRARIARFTGLPQVTPPAGLAATLRPYQQRGLDFLVHATSLGLGAVLADDMGLGKTVQALAWLAHECATAPAAGPALVVCPASVVHNWAAEAARFTPGLRVLVLARGRERHALREAAADHDLIVTNYALLRRDQEEWRKLEFRAVILDEAQNIKNPDAAVTRAALALRARHRLALTGTPLENRALDLWSIVSFLNPGYLGSRAAFSARFDGPDAPPHARALLAAKLRPLLLRRLKREVAADLPPRIEELRRCALTRGQRQLYLAELARSRRLVDRAGATAEQFARSKITILAALTRLRQICCHPALGGGAAGLGSGKFDALGELLDPLLAEGHKVLLFSQFVRCLRLLRADLERRGVACHVLTGQTTKRDQVVRAFSEDARPAVFLISLRAGGTGLNLTSASYVVLFDPWWNPAVEAQAIDRTHRIGQDRTVIAYRMLTEGTIEEKIWSLQQRKAALARDLLGEDGFARTLTRADLEYVFADA